MRVPPAERGGGGKDEGAFLDEWVRAVNQDGSFGRWSWDVSRHPADLPEILQRYNRSVE